MKTVEKRLSDLERKIPVDPEAERAFRMFVAALDRAAVAMGHCLDQAPNDAEVLTFILDQAATR